MGRRTTRTMASREPAAGRPESGSIWLSPKSLLRPGPPPTRTSRCLLVTTAFLEALWILFLLVLVILQTRGGSAM